MEHIHEARADQLVRLSSALEGFEGFYFRKPCGEGGMRLVVRLDVLGEDDSSVEQKCVAKMFKSQAATAKE